AASQQLHLVEVSSESSTDQNANTPDPHFRQNLLENGRAVSTPHAGNLPNPNSNFLQPAAHSHSQATSLNINQAISGHSLQQPIPLLGVPRLLTGAVHLPEITFAPLLEDCFVRSCAAPSAMAPPRSASGRGRRRGASSPPR